MVGTDVHEGGNGFPGFGDGVVLEEFSCLIEEHDGDGFRVFAKAECADGGDGHEEVFVEDFSVEDVFGGPEEDVITDECVGNEVECQGEYGGGLGLLVCEYTEEECKCDEDSPECFGLFFCECGCHLRCLLFAG